MSATQQALEAIALVLDDGHGTPDDYEVPALDILDALLALPKDVRAAALGVRADV